ncbi:NAD(P)H-binding protein [Thalassotalea ponticola]|uniref:NAD(P)H-binding protein n=1 Tax=Thalassotalea ponticola TaxID=1523392 RepID=UPI0025B3AC31|nr:NAD(P)H-binding protein [Thalassotalea ponticola]MDN3653274.1 NAD(P)H-binding protein [Thalassotalea ponticola]
MKHTTVAIFGASGLTGSKLLQRLLSDPNTNHITAFVRQKLPVSPAKLTQLITDFNDTSELHKALNDIDCVYCCLGSTLKQAGSKRQFYHIDVTLISDIAKQCEQANVGHFVVISSIGAKPNGRSFYTRCKGQMETAVSNTQLQNVTIVRPSLLIGERAQFRLAESIGITVNRYFGGLFGSTLKKYQPIDAEDLAKAMHRIGAEDNQSKRRIIENDTLHDIANAT